MSKLTSFRYTLVVKGLPVKQGRFTGKPYQELTKLCSMLEYLPDSTLNVACHLHSASYTCYKGETWQSKCHELLHWLEQHK
jgi:hypothetical protein